MNSPSNTHLWSEHPDRALLDAIAAHHAELDDWDACNTDAERGVILRRWNATGFVDEATRITKARPETLEGLVAKCRYALREWLRDGDTKWQLGWALQAATLEQTLEVLERLQAGAVGQ